MSPGCAVQGSFGRETGHGVALQLDLCDAGEDNEQINGV